MSLSPSYYVWPGETHFGFGTVQTVAELVKQRGGERALVVADAGVIAAGLLEQVTTVLDAGKVAYTVFDGVVANPTIESVNACAALYHTSGADTIIGLGGGSSLDTAKAVKILAGSPAGTDIWEFASMHGDERRPFPMPGEMPPYIAIPTTSGTGAEMTPWALITKSAEKMKFGVGTWSTIPDIALLDPDLTLTLPTFLTAATGLDALSHLIEAYVSTNNNPVLDPMILEGIRQVGQHLRVAVARSNDRQARSAMMQASMIGGIGISSKWLGACHSLAHPLSGICDVHHGLACGIMLPPQMRYSLVGSIERYADVAIALEPDAATLPSRRAQAERAPQAVHNLLVDTNLPTRLSDAGVSEADIEPLSAAAINDLNWWTNPREVSKEALAEMYRETL